MRPSPFIEIERINVNLLRFFPWTKIEAAPRVGCRTRARILQNPGISLRM